MKIPQAPQNYPLISLLAFLSMAIPRLVMAQSMTDIGTLAGGSYSAAYGVSADGSVIVGGSVINGNFDTHAFKYVGTTMTDLGTLGGRIAPLLESLLMGRSLWGPAIPLVIALATPLNMLVLR